MPVGYSVGQVARLAGLYISDPRFAAHFARYAQEASTFAGYLRAAIYANAERHAPVRPTLVGRPQQRGQHA